MNASTNIGTWSANAGCAGLNGSIDTATGARFATANITMMTASGMRTTNVKSLRI